MTFPVPHLFRNRAQSPIESHHRLELLRLAPAEHLNYVATLPSASFLQCPSWAEVKTDWHSEHVGWFDKAGTLVGAALVLYRAVPHTDHCFAYIPEGPLIDWTDNRLDRWLTPLLDHLKRRRRAFTVTMGPPVPVHSWHSRTLKEAVAAGTAKRLHDVPADDTDKRGVAVRERLRALGWFQAHNGRRGGGDAQPRLVFELPLAGRSLDEVWAGFSQRWRRDVNKARKAGVETLVGGPDDLPTFYRLLETTQQRDGFDLGRSLTYYEQQYRALTSEHPDRMRLYLARHDGEVLAAHTLNRVGRRAWYQLGASASHRRDVRPSHAIQWQMIQDAHTAGCTVYDMRGFNDTLDRDDPAFGLLHWKLGTGGQAVEYVGEWSFVLNKPLNQAFKAYLRLRRSS
ncbi:lipid II:glycine glycyltransferase FemX [Kribbella sp. DT2]|uniref:lipid II:glycine glycyltransferase FemX n=1 Tax=Kribbella sp. DT2 TaxID=3393427 RepID=UPI003CEF9559